MDFDVPKPKWADDFYALEYKRRAMAFWRRYFVALDALERAQQATSELQNCGTRPRGTVCRQRAISEAAIFLQRALSADRDPPTDSDGLRASIDFMDERIAALREAEKLLGLPPRGGDAASSAGPSADVAT